MHLYTYEKAKGKRVFAGVYDARSRVYVRRVTQCHFMRKIGGYGIQDEIIVKLLKFGCHSILVMEEGGNTYRSALQEWLEPDIKVLDYGHGKQRFLPLHRMEELRG